MSEFSTLEALEELCNSIPAWNTRLDDLNGQIDLRQIELARLEELERPPTRSIRNKGSTESLRPHDRAPDIENPFLSHDPDNTDDIPLNPFESPKPQQNCPGANQRPGSAGAVRASMGNTRSPKTDSKISPPRVLTRQTSHPTPVAYQRPTVLRKRKTASLASNNTETGAGPTKYRTRSMIIVYYDSAVQLAFEELVKFVSASRNAMRKGKMAAKMAEMKRAAEMEVGDEDDDDEGIDNTAPNPSHLVSAETKPTVSGLVPSSTPHGPEKADSDSMLEEDMKMPKLTFVSTRRMGPTRDTRPKRAENTGIMRVGLLKGYRMGGAGDTIDIFDQLDKILEWCQGQCEHAAHQFLRDGECSTEIENLKRKLGEVKETAQKEIDRMKQEEIASVRLSRTAKPIEGRYRQMSTPTLRRDAVRMEAKQSKQPKPLTVDDDPMQVDDEGVDGMEDEDEMPKMIWKRTRDLGPR